MAIVQQHLLVKILVCDLQNVQLYNTTHNVKYLRKSYYAKYLFPNIEHIINVYHSLKLITLKFKTDIHWRLL